MTVMRALLRAVVLVGVVALSACATLRPPYATEPAPWLPAYDPPDPGDGPPHPRN